MMKIDISSSNPALISIIEDPAQVITLDANFLIPPYRKRLTKRGVKFEQFREIWLDPIFGAFPNLAIHEAVYEELVDVSPQAFVDEKYRVEPPGIIIHRDSSLTAVESVLRDSIEEKIAFLTDYDPMLDNKDDRGEVKSLS